MAAQLLFKQNDSVTYNVHGICRKNSINLPLLKSLALSTSRLVLHFGDVTDPLFMLNLIKRTEPDEIYNFAAQSQVAHSFLAANSTFETNTKSVWHICESLLTLGLVSKTKVFHASTSEMYGSHEGKSDGCFTESSEFRPMSPYAVSKVAAYHTCSYFFRVHGVQIATAISFNHESPLRSEQFVTSKIVKHAVLQTYYLAS
mmetsp:Transcript_23273/g.31074  ORF Transcript_23273/g.31074 Transcript_23273/m.31074 type:complete len:201 (-) Transcript_23273:548-1150(-)